MEWGDIHAILKGVEGMEWSGGDARVQIFCLSSVLSRKLTEKSETLVHGMEK